MSRIFLSYSREDKRCAEALARVLEDGGHDVWWDCHIDTGAQFSKEIERALAAADVVVVAWSKKAAESPWVRDEAALARDSGRLLPVTIDGCDPPLGFRQFQTMDLSRWKGGKKDPRTAAFLMAVERRLKGEAAPWRSGRSTSRWRAMLGWAAAAALLFIVPVAGFLIYRAETRQGTLALAVLPFTDLSPTHDKAYLAEGIGEQILSSLGTVPKLRVIGRTSAQAVGADADPRKLRSALGVTHLVEGSARTSATDLRVDVRLIRTSDGSELWTHEYRGSLNDIFRIQDDVAKSVVAQLNLELVPHATAAAKASVGAYEMYLAARALQRERTLPKLQQAMQIARQIVADHPEYARGHALLAELIYMLSNASIAYGNTPLAKARPLAAEQAKEAIRLAPDAPEGYAALGLIYIDAPTAESIAALQKAVRLDPSRAELRVWLGFCFDSLGRNDEEAVQYRLASEVEPLWPVPVYNWLTVLAASNRVSEAFQAVDGFRKRGGAASQAWRFEAAIRGASGDFSGAVDAWHRALAADPNVPGASLFTARTLHFLGFQPAPELIGRVPSLYLRDLMQGGEAQMRRRITADPGSIWNSSGQTEVLRTLAKANDWKDVVGVLDAAPPELRNLCVTAQYFTPTLVWALRGAGRTDEARKMLDCYQRDITKQLGMTYRSGGDFAGELEEMQAAVLALRGDRRAIDWLNRAVDRGWAGQYFSPNLHDWREFDALWADPRMNAVQQRINAIYSRERAETARELRQR